MSRQTPQRASPARTSTAASAVRDTAGPSPSSSSSLLSYAYFASLFEPVEAAEPLEHRTPLSNAVLYCTLALICALSFSIRMFSVVRWER